MDPLGAFADPIIERLASIEDWLEMTLWASRGAPDDAKPIGAVEFKRRAIAAAEAAKNKPKAQPIDVAAEMARRRRASKTDTANTNAPRRSNSGGANPNSAAQRMKAELAERRKAAANANH